MSFFDGRVWYRKDGMDGCQGVCRIPDGFCSASLVRSSNQRCPSKGNVEETFADVFADACRTGFVALVVLYRAQAS